MAAAPTASTAAGVAAGICAGGKPISEFGEGEEIGDTLSTMQIDGQIQKHSKRLIIKRAAPTWVPFRCQESAEMEWGVKGLPIRNTKMPRNRANKGERRLACGVQGAS